MHPVWAERDAHSWTLCRRCAPGLQRLAQEPEWQALAGFAPSQGEIPDPGSRRLPLMLSTA